MLMFLFFPPVMCNYAIGSECKIKSIVQREMCVCNAGVVPMDTGLQRGLVFFFLIMGRPVSLFSPPRCSMLTL